MLTYIKRGIMINLGVSVKIQNNKMILKNVIMQQTADQMKTNFSGFIGFLIEVTLSKERI